MPNLQFGSLFGGKNSSSSNSNSSNNTSKSGSSSSVFAAQNQQPGLVFGTSLQEMRDDDVYEFRADDIPGFNDPSDPGLWNEELQDIAFQVPRFLVDTCMWILQNGLREQGPFRTEPDHSRANEVQRQLDTDKDYTFPDTLEEAIPQSLLKRWLRDLKDTVVPARMVKQFVRCGDRAAAERSASMNMASEEHREVMATNLRRFVNTLPWHHRSTLHYLMCFLNEVSGYAARTSMDSANLATVFAPNLAFDLMSMQDINLLTQVMITHFHYIFDPSVAGCAELPSTKLSRKAEQQAQRDQDAGASTSTTTTTTTATAGQGRDWTVEEVDEADEADAHEAQDHGDTQGQKEQHTHAHSPAPHKALPEPHHHHEEEDAHDVLVVDGKRDEEDSGYQMPAGFVNAADDDDWDDDSYDDNDFDYGFADSMPRGTAPTPAEEPTSPAPAPTPAPAPASTTQDAEAVRALQAQVAMLEQRAARAEKAKEAAERQAAQLQQRERMQTQSQSASAREMEQLQRENASLHAEVQRAQEARTKAEQRQREAEEQQMRATTEAQESVERAEEAQRAMQREIEAHERTREALEEARGRVEESKRAARELRAQLDEANRANIHEQYERVIESQQRELDRERRTRMAEREAYENQLAAMRKEMRAIQLNDEEMKRKLAHMEMNYVEMKDTLELEIEERTQTMRQMQELQAELHDTTLKLDMMGYQARLQANIYGSGGGGGVAEYDAYGMAHSPYHGGGGGGSPYRGAFGTPEQEQVLREEMREIARSKTLDYRSRMSTRL